MHADSRKAQRDRYAHNWANLAFSQPLARGQEGMSLATALYEGTEPSLLAHQQVHAGIIGFVSNRSRPLRP